MRLIAILLLFMTVKSIFAANISTSRSQRFHKERATCDERYPDDDEKFFECLGLTRYATAPEASIALEPVDKSTDAL